MLRKRRPDNGNQLMVSSAQWPARRFADCGVCREFSETMKARIVALLLLGVALALQGFRAQVITLTAAVLVVMWLALDPLRKEKPG
jgi:cobalamin synthase